MVTNNKHVFALNAYKNEPERNIIVFFYNQEYTGMERYVNLQGGQKN